MDLNNGKILLGNSSRQLIMDSTATNALTLGELNINWSGKISNSAGTNYIDFAATDNIINIGSNLQVKTDGSIYYKGSELTNYINNLITTALAK
jgi:hypothetical protein